MMGATFCIRGVGYDVDDYSSFVDMSYSTCEEIFARLRIDADVVAGEIRAKELKVRCEAALESPEAAQDGGLPAVQEDNYHFMGRPAGRINLRIKELLTLCERAGELGLIHWA
jgi:hypothetical protein